MRKTVGVWFAVLLTVGSARSAAAQVEPLVLDRTRLGGWRENEWRLVSASGLRYLVFRLEPDLLTDNHYAFELCQRAAGGPPVEPVHFFSYGRQNPRPVDREAADALVSAGKLDFYPDSVRVLDRLGGGFVLFESYKPDSDERAVLRLDDQGAFQWVRTFADLMGPDAHRFRTQWYGLRSSIPDWHRGYLLDEAGGALIVAAGKTGLLEIRLDDGEVREVAKPRWISWISQGIGEDRELGLALASEADLPRDHPAVHRALEIARDRSEPFGVRLRAAYLAVTRRAAGSEEFRHLAEQSAKVDYTGHMLADTVQEQWLGSARRARRADYRIQVTASSPDGRLYLALDRRQDRARVTWQLCRPPEGADPVDDGHGMTARWLWRPEPEDTVLASGHADMLPSKVLVRDAGDFVLFEDLYAEDALVLQAYDRAGRELWSKTLGQLLDPLPPLVDGEWFRSIHFAKGQQVIDLITSDGSLLSIELETGEVTRR